MIADMREILVRSQNTLLQDAAGAVSLAVLLVVGLSLPAIL